MALQTHDLFALLASFGGLKDVAKAKSALEFVDKTLVVCNRVLQHFDGFSLGLHESAWIPKVSHAFPWIRHGFTSISHGLPCISMCFHDYSGNLFHPDHEK